MSRERIFAGVRVALVGSGSERARRSTVAERLAHPRRHAPVTRSMVSEEDALAARFKAHLQRLGVDLIEVSREGEIPSAVGRYLAGLGLPLRLRRGYDGLLACLPWDAEPGLAVDIGPANAADTAGLSHAVVGVAETGTLVLTSGVDNPVTLGFLPETHIVVLSADAIVGSYEEALGMVQAANGGSLPRTVNLVTGASRTGDIGGKIVVGAHGPRHLAVVIYGAGAAAGASASASA